MNNVQDNYVTLHALLKFFLSLLFGTGNLSYTTQDHVIFVVNIINCNVHTIKTPAAEIVKGLAIIKEYLIWLGDDSWRGRICRFYDTERKENRPVRFINAVTGETLPTHPHIMRILTTRNGY